MTTPRLFLSAAVRRGLDAIGAGMLDHACPDQRAAIAWARGLSESITAQAAQGRRVSRVNTTSSKRERQINQS